MTKKYIIKTLEKTLKEYNALWDRIESLEYTLDDAEDRHDITTDITGWGCSEMRDNLTHDIDRLQEAIKNLKQRK